MKYLFYLSKYTVKRKSFKKVQVMKIDETIKEIKSKNVSVSRFGDGEFRLIDGIESDSFQENSDVLGMRLKEVLMSHSDKLLVCVPNVFNKLNELTVSDGLAWAILLNQYGIQWSRLLDSQISYGDANFTRPYIDRKKKKQSRQIFKKIKRIWNNRDIVIVEGRLTRFGVGNDLLDNVRSISRIICPATNAFSKYDEIINSVISNSKKNDLILIALGPTATVMAYDLSKIGMQAIDIGHTDIEYEWFLNKATVKTAIPGKYVNEVKNGRSVMCSVNDPKYNEQIVDVIV